MVELELTDYTDTVLVLAKTETDAPADNYHSYMIALGSGTFNTPDPY